ncbi:MAG: hypothetical protein A3A86_04255 [Elusimicrobia bacterium RIFCSPLOWO2_01_FULL_60_11]|nr:MAG: hypothetical protein A3A86_04255 [Elusimicrobia bacterium RIFCSPLOWO2_01_FULL_60_11]
MVREGLFVEIKSALALAKKTGAPVIREDIRVKFEGKFLDVGLKVIPLHSPEHPAHDFLVLFEEPRLRQRKPGKRESKVSKQEAGASENSSLRHELDMTKESLQSTIENQDVTNEELKSSNEEILSSNEELQSTNEELETAKEELQSTNEELITANEEVKSRNFELIESNKELAFQSKEKEKRAAELIVANKELAFQNKEKEKRAAELIVANKELVFQSKEKEKRAAELGVANKELAFQNKEKEKRAAELAQANSDLDNLISSANVAIIMLGSDLCVRQFTKSAERALHIKAADIGRPVSRLELDIHVPDLESLVASAVKSGRIKEREVQNKQGHWHNIQIRPFKTGEDKIEGALIVYIDIQSIKGVEKLTRSLSELEAARKYNQWIVESVQIPLIILDHNLRIITANPAFYQTFKVSEEKTEKQSIYDLGNGQWNIPKLKQLLEDILPQSKVFNNFQVEHVFPDLGRRIMTLNARRLEHQNQILLAIEDITDRKNIEGLLAVEKRNLEKVNHELDQFVHMASHDLRSPLRVICSFAEILEKDCQGKLNPESVDSLKHIILGTQRMNELITDLLTLSRITKVENPYEPVNIGDLIGSVKRRLQAEIERSNALITTHDSLSAVVCCFDRIKMREVFTNLIHNAIKYSSKHSGDRPQVEIGMTGQKDHYEFSVKDNGIGIDPRYHQQIFDMFKRLHSKDQYEGTGAGLYIVKTIVEEHGGRVWVESQLGQGATFYFTIPKDLKAGNEGPAEALQLAGVTA